MDFDLTSMSVIHKRLGYSLRGKLDEGTDVQV